MKKIILYSHNGSKNHGCEAIVRSTAKILKESGSLQLYSFNKEEDSLYGLDKVLEIKQANIKRSNAKQNGLTFKGRIKQMLKKLVPLNLLMKFQKRFGMNGYKDIASAEGDLFVSIGGDIYCYASYAVMDYLNEELNKRAKTVLWGCSITPERIKTDNNLRSDLNHYSLINARESITYNALKENGITKNTHLFPDPAFALDIQQTALPDNFIKANTVGINLSPMVQNLESGDNLAYKNVQELIKHILDTTDMNICLIVHVIWGSNNDLEPLTALYNEFKNTGRVCLTGQTQNCCELKYIISQCRFLVAARTHASIAAYSTQVPTLVIGYSVKAKGIARDIFGSEEGYVVSVQGIRTQDALKQAFINLQKNEDKIRAHYKTFMPQYINSVYQGAEEVKKLLGNL